MRRHSKWLRLLAILLGLSLLATACGSDDEGDNASETTSEDGGSSGSSDVPDTFPDPVTPTKGGVLKLSMSDNIDCYNGLSYYGIAWSLFYFMARGLYGYENTVKTPDDNKVRADLATDLPEISDDGLTYTVTLREGLTFPDGSPVTAADVKATFEYMNDPNIQCATGGPPSSGYYNVLEGYDDYTNALKADPAAKATISGITAVDDLTTTFKLSKPDGGFLRALAMAWSFIRPASTPHTKTDTPPPHVGPYTVESYDADKTLTIVREPTWAKNVAAGVPDSDDQNNVDGLELSIGISDENALAGLEKNEIDISYDNGAPIGSDVPKVANDSQFDGRFFSVPVASIDYVFLRTDAGPLTDPTLRQAVNYAIDRENLAKIYGGSLSRIPWSEILSKNLMEGSDDEDGTVYTYDEDEAKSLVEKSGADTPIKVKFVHFADAPGPAIAAAVKENLDAVGFDVELQAASADVIYGIYEDPKSDHDIGLAGWGQDFGDAVTFFGPLLTCPGGTPTGSNYAYFCDEEFDAALEKIKEMPDGDERYQAMAKLSTDTMKEKAPWAPITNLRRPLLVSERVGNFIYGPIKQWYFANYFVKE